MEPILQVRQLSVSFGCVRALRGLDMDIADGSVTALVGPNGAGKTTALDAITGFVPASGTIRLNGREIQSLPAHARAYILAVVIRGRPLPSRGSAAKIRLPAAPEPGSLWRQVTIAGIAVAVAALFLPYDFREGLVNSLVFTVIALSLVVATGFAGQVSLFQMGLAGFTALMVVRWSQLLGVGFPFDGILAVIAAGIAGVVVGLPSLRVRGIELAILTLAASYAFENMVLDNPSLVTTNDGITGAAVGGIGYAVLEHVAHLGQYLPLIGGIGLIITAILNPEGIAGVMSLTVGRIRGRFPILGGPGGRAANIPAKVIATGAPAPADPADPVPTTQAGK